MSDDPLSTESTSAEGEIYYTTMNPAITSTPDCGDCQENETEEGRILHSVCYREMQ